MPLQAQKSSTGHNFFTSHLNLTELRPGSPKNKGLPPTEVAPNFSMNRIHSVHQSTTSSS
ncbi:hypothetical protein [Rubritalea tangerina]|uniref:hypothetical protein n=1 Tax=Rubritalea tangerina TaxID=430798 RepID=UPI0036235AC9